MGGGVAADRTGGARCALCGGAAAVHCAADAAFLCTRCDARVHGANFLASRHVRRRVSEASSAAASSGSCVSTADSAESTAAPATAAPVTGAGRNRKQRRRPRAEAVLEGWAKRMGLAPGAARRRAAAAVCTLRALGRGVAATRVPLRVAMAAALWAEVSATAGYGGKAALLCKLEATAHVPARLVLTVASWVARERHRPAPAADAEEGWAECC